jgi:ATP-dependent protease HslVU (ClpYQ) peptidase subunit
MTTLVYRDGILAADTQITYGATLMPGKCRKVHKLPNGSLYGHTGSLEIGELMKRRLIKCCEEAEPVDLHDIKTENYEGVLVGPTGQIMFYENYTWIGLDVPYVAMGSGKEHAYGALQMGASARQAVKAAMALDPGSGGKIQWLEIPYWEGERSLVEQVWEK